MRSGSGSAQSLSVTTPTGQRGRTGALVVGALGIVYGDIGTSPLYAIRQCFNPQYGLMPTPANVLGVLSLVFWSLIVVISIKYLGFVMRADNRGEGGILALMALVPPARGRERRWLLMTLGVFGAALLYGDGMITPAISVLSAVEGLTVRTPALAPLVVPIAIGILVALFLAQRLGTARVGSVFGPITILWFTVIAMLGFRAIIRAPGVLQAVNPIAAWSFLAGNAFTGFVALGAVFLVVTGGEALYADMGHFGRRPIRLAWFTIVLPSLLLNYFGQGALMLSSPASAAHPFYSLVPSWALYPTIALATLATIIASQAVISGAFSLTRQAIQLGFSPRMTISYTSPEEVGQIYVPFVNWVLMAATIGLVLGFGSSSRLAAAYGVAVTTTMIITTGLAFVVSRTVWRWHLAASLVVTVLFLAVDLAFFSANLLKVGNGGWFPLLVGAGVFTLMSTWHRGRLLLMARREQNATPIDAFIETLARSQPMRVPGTAVFMTNHPHGVPAMLLHNLKHNKVLHEQVLILTIDARAVPRVDKEQRLELDLLDFGLVRITAHYGFMETPNVIEILRLAAAAGVAVNFEDTTYFLGRDTPVASGGEGLARWRAQLFGLMSRNASRATDFFRIPSDRAFEIGGHIKV
jgi:KUP system potassium uptake protein